MTQQHGGQDAGQASLAEPSLAEQARTLVYLGKSGSLSTLSAKHPDWPFGSVMPYGLDDRGRPIFLISSMAMHARNLLRDPRASLLITQAERQQNLLGLGRITLLGTVERVPDADLIPVRQNYLERHPEASSWVDFGDFAFFRMQVVDSYFVGGFGVMGWVTAAEYFQAEIDPLADSAASILEHMNDDHGDALIRIAQHFGQCAVEQVTMLAVDRLGCHLQVRHQGEVQSLRLPFPREARSAETVRAILVEMVRKARAAGS